MMTRALRCNAFVSVTHYLDRVFNAVGFDPTGSCDLAVAIKAIDAIGVHESFLPRNGYLII